MINLLQKTLRKMRLRLKVPTPDFPSHVLRDRVAPTPKLMWLAHLFLFVAIGCTNLADSVAATSLQMGQPVDIGGVWSAPNNVYDLRGISAVGTSGVTPEGGGATTQQAVTPIASINNSMTNREITVQAMITNVRTPNSERAPYTVTLNQDDATMPLVFWSNILPPDALPQLTSKVKAGNLIRAKVKIGDYRGRLQLRLQGAANLEVVSTAGAASGEPARSTVEPAAVPQSATNTTTTVTRKKMAIGEIKGDWVDRVVTISGTIAASDNIGSGQRLHVQDGTGEIQVVLWENTLGGLSATEFHPGCVITVTGPIRLYRGRTEIVPDEAGDVKLAAQ